MINNKSIGKPGSFFNRNLPAGRVILLILLIPFLYCCDPMRRLQMKNESSGEAVFKWHLKEDEDRLTQNFFRISNNDVLEFGLKKNPPFNFVNMSFGEGLWTPSYVKTISEQLVSLHIYSPTDTVIIDSSGNIYSFLMQQRRGLGKRKILLVAH